MSPLCITDKANFDSPDNAVLHSYLHSPDLSAYATEFIGYFNSHEFLKSVGRTFESYWAVQTSINNWDHPAQLCSIDLIMI